MRVLGAACEKLSAPCELLINFRVWSTVLLATSGANWQEPRSLAITSKAFINYKLIFEIYIHWIPHRSAELTVDFSCCRFSFSSRNRAASAETRFELLKPGTFHYEFTKSFGKVKSIAATSFHLLNWSTYNFPSLCSIRFYGHLNEICRHATSP